MTDPSPTDDDGLDEPESESGDIEPLLAYIRDQRGFDFTGYKRASLHRRIRKRMQAVQAADPAAYLAVLEAEPREYAELFNTILINVTSFRRDPEAWEYLEREVVPRLVQRSSPEVPMRCWSAGCASGEEPYSVAVMLCEAFGEERFRNEVKIYATDADNDALTEARAGTYAWSALVEGLGEDLAERYFEHSGEQGTFRHDLRRSLIFGRHDLLQDPPISRVDLLVCRNTLMYFTAEVQRRVLGNFHFALRPGGALFLGKSESLVTRTNLFRAVDLRNHLFEKNGLGGPTRPTVASAGGGVPDRAGPRTLLGPAFELFPIAQLIVDARENLMHANRAARTMFGIGTAQLRQPLRDLDLSYRPVELRSLLERVLSNDRPIILHGVENPGGQTPDLSFLDVHLLPLGDEELAGVLVAFTPVGHQRLLQDELERTQREVQTAYEELQSVIEELETTNEELQSTNEELETTNEELHSTNEELETMNEELQSTNDELGTVNSELRQRGSDLDDANRFLHAILRSLRAAVVVITSDLTVRAWNEQAEELWGLRAAEVTGQHFLNLDIGLPVDQLRQPIRACLAGETDSADVEVDAVNRRGRPIRCSVSVSPLLAGSAERSAGADGVILVMTVD